MFLPPETSQNCVSSLTGKFVGFQGCTENSSCSLFFPLGSEQRRTCAKMPEPGQFLHNHLILKLVLVPSIGKVLTAFLHIQNAIPRIRIPHHGASSWCINYFLPDIKQVFMACSHLLSRGHITPNSELWDTWTNGDHLEKRTKNSLRKENENRRPTNLTWGCSIAVQGKVDSKQAIAPGVSVLAFLHPLAPTPEDPALLFKMLWYQPVCAY